ncbi:hypothetical protein [Paraburkholderia phytofirmans]|uniref:Uncharacterized protein n=1 Tax=Paraburkholderia phytofirmans (strain DSM 17436 / LMG 22146 / PsJN) TaxID=398527 RepID=B2TH49_PARPJ|nr:hypothetical protein [Paraburkholderia phytofirmans]ACD21598.1 hypothetical protein Bphyt_7313 [Paraburkholderia phytofirmans PsJN]
MEKKNYQVGIDVSVYDPETLFVAALDHAMRIDGLSKTAALEELKPGGEIDPRACLIMILDPGSVPGCGINESTAQEY